MMKKAKLAVLVSGMFWVAAAGATTAAPIASDQRVAPETGARLFAASTSWTATPGVSSVPRPAELLAKRGADNPPEPCDDHGMDLCRSAA